MGSKPCWSLLQSWQRRLLAVRSAHVPAPFPSFAPLPPAVCAGAVRVVDDGQHGLGEGVLLRPDGHARDVGYERDACAGPKPGTPSPAR